MGTLDLICNNRFAFLINDINVIEILVYTVARNSFRKEVFWIAKIRHAHFPSFSFNVVCIKVCIRIEAHKRGRRYKYFPSILVSVCASWPTSFHYCRFAFLTLMYMLPVCVETCSRYVPRIKQKMDPWRDHIFILNAYVRNVWISYLKYKFLLKPLSGATHPSLHTKTPLLVQLLHYN
jgi:hypothetical protein